MGSNPIEHSLEKEVSTSRTLACQVVNFSGWEWVRAVWRTRVPHWDINGRALNAGRSHHDVRPEGGSLMNHTVIVLDVDRTLLNDRGQYPSMVSAPSSQPL